MRRMNYSSSMKLYISWCFLSADRLSRGDARLDQGHRAEDPGLQRSSKGNCSLPVDHFCLCVLGRKNKNTDEMFVSLWLQGFSFRRASSYYKSHNSSLGSRGQQGDERRPQLVKSCSVAPGWQPWMPVPSCEPSILDAEDEDSAFSSVPTLPSLSSSSTSSSTSSSSNSLSTPAPCPTVPPATSSSGLGIVTATGDVACGRRRHRSQPQPHTGFPFSLDDDGIRTTDV